jgi:DNA-binding FadR family transcriptional regulator
MSEINYSPVVRQVKLPVQVADQLQGMILAKHLRVGDRLPAERDLCEQFKVSRTVIREAIRILEAKGLLISLEGSGTYVRAIQSSDVIDSLGMYLATQNQEMPYTELMELRRVLETQIAALAAERASEEALAELSLLQQAFEASIGDWDSFAKLDLEFHMALARATGNSLFELILNPFMEPLYEGRRLASEIPGVAEEAIALHQQIMERVITGDSEGAAEAMLLHLEQSCRVTLQALIEKSKEKEKHSE